MIEKLKTTPVRELIRPLSETALSIGEEKEAPVSTVMMTAAVLSFIIIMVVIPSHEEPLRTLLRQQGGKKRIFAAWESLNDAF